MRTFLAFAFIASITAADWPQLQADAARTGRTADTLAAPYRARWVWIGPAKTLRNRDSQTGWPDDLAPRDGYSYPGMPTSVPFTIADSTQPVLVAGRVFVGTQEGTAYAIGADDGATLWSAPIPGGTVTAAAVAGNRVVFTTLTGNVVAFDVATGAQAWSYAMRRSITGAACVDGGRVIVADHGGWVCAIDPTSGVLVWEQRLGAPVFGGLCSDGVDCFVGAEDLKLYALRLSDGQSRVSARLRGQSFRMLWPVVYNGTVWVHSVTTPIIGSEYVMESLMTGSASLSEEETNIGRWLAGDTNGGAWADAGRDWRHLFPLRTTDLGERSVPLVGPADGVGVPVHPVVIDQQGRALTYVKTRYPSLTKLSNTFGTAYSMDICGIDPDTGKRIPIDNGHLASPWPWESDNLYGLSVAGNVLWLRQNFRGTQAIDLAASSCRGVSACVRHRDGGTFNFDVVYWDNAPTGANGQPGPGQGTEVASTLALGRTAPITVGARAYFAENFAITCVEHKP